MDEGSPHAETPHAGTPETESDGGVAPGLDEAALYTLVREAVKDALLDVIGTLLLVGIAFVLVVAGVRGALEAPSPGLVAVSVGVAAVGVYLAAATLGLIPPAREWV